MDFKPDNNEGQAPVLLQDGDFVFKQEAPPPKPDLFIPPVKEIKEEPAAKTVEAEQPKPTEVVAKEKPAEAVKETIVKPEIPEVKPDFTAFLGEATKGAVKTPEELQEKLAKLQQLELDSQKPKYKSPQEEKIAKYLEEYGGTDYGTAFQTYLKLQNTDVQSLDPATAIKEAMVLDNMKAGMTAARAELAADREMEKRYADDEDGIFKERDSYAAKQRLESLKQESKAPTANPQQEAQRKQQEQEQQANIQHRTSYLNKVNEVFSKTPEPTKIKVSADPKEDLTFKAYEAKDDSGKRINPVELKPLVENYVGHITERYMIKDAQGNPTGVFDPALIAKDLEKINSFETKIKEAVEHGIHIGTERYIKSRANINTETPTTRGAGGAAESKEGEFIFSRN